MLNNQNTQYLELRDAFHNLRIRDQREVSLDHLCNVLERSADSNLYSSTATTETKSLFVKELSRGFSAMYLTVRAIKTSPILDKIRLFLNTIAPTLTEIGEDTLSRSIRALINEIKNKDINLSSSALASIEVSKATDSGSSFGDGVFEKLGFPYDKEINEILSLEYGEECKRKILKLAQNLQIQRYLSYELYEKIIDEIKDKLNDERKIHYFARANRMLGDTCMVIFEK